MHFYSHYVILWNSSVFLLHMGIPITLRSTANCFQVSAFIHWLRLKKIIYWKHCAIIHINVQLVMSTRKNRKQKKQSWNDVSYISYKINSHYANKSSCSVGTLRNRCKVWTLRLFSLYFIKPRQLRLENGCPRQLLISKYRCPPFRLGWVALCKEELSWLYVK